MTVNEVQNQINHLFRTESGKMISVLVKIFGTENLELAEDVVQEAFIAGLEKWNEKGMPQFPKAWLYQVAKNKAIDVLRSHKYTSTIDFSDSERVLFQSEYTLTPTMNVFWTEDHIKNDFLGMMYACCHPDLKIENQVSFILKSLCGFSTKEIAKTLLTSEDTISKRIYRTKSYFRKHKIKPEIPEGKAIKVRTLSVIKIIYLMFNEGYNSTHSETVIRKDMIHQCIFLCQSLIDNKHSQLPEAYALLALIYFHGSRLEGRTGELNSIIVLKEQSREKWDQNMITKGNDFLNMASFGPGITSYHLEAAIAYEHCIAISYNETNWKAILNYYNLLLKISPDPIVDLNRCLVILELEGPFVAIKEIENIKNKTILEKYYLYHAILGSVYGRLGLGSKAKKHFEMAIKLTQSFQEKELLRNKIEKI